jgi:peptide/nickel transport system substrate-binding protein
MKDSPATRFALTTAVVAILAAACTGSSSTPAPGLVPVTGGTLTVAIDSGPAYADPSLDSDAGSLLVANQVVEGLVGLRPGSTSEIVPVLAAALPTSSPDGLAWTFKLRTGIKFHDGTALDATAVKANYDRWRTFPSGDLRSHATFFAAAFGGFDDGSNLASVDVTDDTTLVFHLKAAQSSFLVSQAGPAFGIQSPAAIKANDGNNATLAANAYANGTGGKGTAMVGTGPFSLSEWKSGDHATLVRNADYWNADGRAYLDRVVFKPLSDPAARTSALKGGSVDLVETLEPAAVAGLTVSSGLRVFSREASCQVAQLFMNQVGTFAGRVSPLSNTAIRLAIASAVQKDVYASAFYAGGAVAADNWLPAGAQFYKREYLPEHDLSKARSYVAQSGFATAQLIVELAYPSGTVSSMLPDAKGLAQAIARDLQAVGFAVNLRTEAIDAFATDAAAGKFQMWLGGASCLWAGPDNMLGLFRYVNGAPQGSLGYYAPNVDQAIAMASASPTDESARAAWQAVQDLVAADMPTVPLLDVLPQAGAQGYVVGFVGSGLGLEKLATVWLNK